MKFVDNLTKKEYIDFFNSFKYSHFLQSYAWGEAVKETRGKIPCYVGLKDDNNKLVAAALLLKKNMPFGLCYYYCSRGYLIDFKDFELVKTFTLEIKKYMKRTKGIYVKINPEIMYQEIDDDGNKINDGKNNYDIFNNLISLGYKHMGFVKLHENNEPRYTFRRYFNDNETMEDVDKTIARNFMKNINRGYGYNMKVDFNGSVDDFYELNKFNAKKDGFIQYSDKFYHTLADYGKKYNNLLVINISVNGKELYKDSVDKYNKLKDDIDNDRVKKNKIVDFKNQLARLDKEIKVFEEYKDMDDMVICSLINGIANDCMWTMYIGNNDLGEFLFAVNRSYYESIRYCIDNHFRFLDLYGTVGDPKTKYKNLGGLHAYKKSFGGDYIEFIGEFDLVNNKVLYVILPVILGIYRKIIKLVRKK